MKSLPESEEIREKADTVAAKSRIIEKTKDRISWPGMIIFGAAILLAVHAVAEAIFVA